MPPRTNASGMKDSTAPTNARPVPRQSLHEARIAWGGRIRCSRRSSRLATASGAVVAPERLAAAGDRQAEVLVGALRRHAALPRALQEAFLKQEGLVDVLDGLGVLAGRRRERLETDRTAGELLGDGEQERAV